MDTLFKSPELSSVITCQGCMGHPFKAPKSPSRQPSITSLPRWMLEDKRCRSSLPKMQVAKDAILPPNRPMQPVSGLELGLTAVCITLSLVLLVLSGSSLVQLQRRAMTAPTLVAELTH